VHKVSPHGRLPIPNDEDYNLNPSTYDREFYQEDGLQGRFEIDLTGEIGMDVDNVMVDDDDDGDEVRNAKDLQMLERLRVGNDNEDNIPPSDSVDYFDWLIVMMRLTIQLIPIMKIICNIHVILCNFVLFILHLFLITSFFFLIAGD
jgi:hypothetical protein